MNDTIANFYSNLANGNNSSKDKLLIDIFSRKFLMLSEDKTEVQTILNTFSKLVDFCPSRSKYGIF
jgi:hypothetical protein